MNTPSCAQCSERVDLHDRDVRFTEPEPVLRLEALEQADVRMSGESASESVFMEVPALGAFVRALLSVRLTGGHSVTYGVWVGIDPADFSHVVDVWWKPEYVDLRLEGTLANVVEPWGLYGSRVTLRVLNEDETPYCVESADEMLAAVINDEWDHRQVLSLLPR